MSVFVAAQTLFGIDLTIMCLTLGLALPVLCVTALPSITLFDTLARLVLSQRLKYRVRGKCTDNVVAARHELAVGDPAFEARTTAVTACREMNGSFGSNPGAVRVQFGCFRTLCDSLAPLGVKLSVSELLTSR
ncbi:MAG: hypothetical protein ACRDPY_36605 [Streptosporangiaceae bacterium]